MILAVPQPPLPAHELLVFLLQVAVLLAGAFGLGRLAERFGMPAIVGELLTGVVLGPSLIGHLAPDFARWLIPPIGEQMHLLDAVGQIGVLLLVGVTGAHIDMALLRRRKSSAVLVSFFGLVIPLGLGVAVGMLMPADMRGGGIPTGVFALFLGVAMCVSAIPVIAKTLADMRMLHRDVAQLTLASGTVDDSVGWFLLSIVSAAAGVGVTAGAVTRSVLYLVGFVALAVVLGRPLIARVMQVAARSGNTMTSIVFAVVLVILGGALTQSLGMEAIFGAFVVGILIGLPGAADQGHLAPLRTIVLAVLAPLFMATAGLRMDLTALLEPSIALAAVVVLAIAIIGKFVGAYIGAKLARIGHWEAVALGAGMNARGVVEVIVALTGLRLGVLTAATYTIVVVVAIVTSLMAPPLLRWAVGHLDQNDDETLRRATHDSWAGAVAVAVAEK